jgi:hypothetical protein
MIKVYTGLKGFAVFLFFIAGTVLVISIFSWGIAKAVQLLLPLLIVLSYLLIIVFLLAILPATFFKNLRPTLYLYSMLMSQMLGVSTWMMSFFFLIRAFGFGAVIFAFLFQLLAPIALIAAILKSSWPIVVHLSLWIGFAYGMKFYGRWLLNLNSRNQKKSDIIDVDAIEVR